MYRYEVSQSVRDDIFNRIGRELFYLDTDDKWYINADTVNLSVQYYDSASDSFLNETLDQMCTALYGTDFAANSTQHEYTNQEHVIVDNTQLKVYDEFTSAEKIPQFANASATFNMTTNFANDTCELLIKCPGTIGTTGRYLKDGYSFTDVYHWGDRVNKLEVVDVDNILGFGAGVVVKAYHDTAVPEPNQGWLLWRDHGGVGGELDLENAGGWGVFPAGFYLRATFLLATGGTATKAGINVFWADDES